ncbi:MAG: hypothetical protein K1X89_04765 [Myxococcaceae bacterium]|nr:hypothetical protein [Myxococcaceae bacterium]
MALKTVDPHRGNRSLSARATPSPTPTAKKSSPAARGRRPAAEPSVAPASPPATALTGTSHTVTPFAGKGLEAVGHDAYGPVVGEYVGTHHAESVRTPRDERYQAAQERHVPKRADFALQGLSLLQRAGERPIYDRPVNITRADGTTASINLMKAANDSIDVDDFYLALEEVLRTENFSLSPTHASWLGLEAAKGATTVPVSGATILSAIDATIAEAVRLSEKSPPEAAPIPSDSPAMRENFLKMLKRFAIQAVFHSRDLTTVHVAMGHDPKKEKQLNETLKHDLVEWAPLKDLVWQLERRPHDPWMDQWLRSEVAQRLPSLVADLPADRLLTKDETRWLYARVKASDLTFNCSALNPHNLTAMFRWGDAREDCNVLIDPHRLSPHHNGSSQNDVDFQQRAINFLSHHMPREHMGVRHEQRGEWDTKAADGTVVPFGKLEAAFATDPAIRQSTLLQQIARDGAHFFRAAEEAGFTVPWQKMKVPGTTEFVQLDAAYQTLQSNNTMADDLVVSHTKAAAAALPATTPGMAQKVTALLKEMDALTPGSDPAHVERSFAALVGAGTRAADHLAVAEVGQALLARLTQLSPGSLKTVDTFVPAAERVEAKLYAFAPELAPTEGHLFLSHDTAHAMRARLDGLAQAAADSRAKGDSSSAQVYADWQRLLEGGFTSVAH